jgi:hypothetical protein
MSNVTSDDVAPSASFTRNLNELEYAGTAQRLSTRCHLSLLPGVPTLNEFRIEGKEQQAIFVDHSGVWKESVAATSAEGSAPFA